MACPVDVTCLVLVGAAPTSVTAALAWLRLAQHPAPDAQPTNHHAMLVVSVARHAQLLSALPDALGTQPPGHWPKSLDAGFHPLVWGNFNVVLCVGPTDVLLPDCVCHASHVWVGSGVSTATVPGLVARLCAQRAELTWEAPHPAHDPIPWLAAGFKPVALAHATPHTTTQAVYDPRWPVQPVQALTPGQAIVIGAGLAGAAVAWCLVRAGWHVCLLDQHVGAAQGASGLPVGMLSAHVTAHDTLMSELSRTGMPLHMRELLAHVPEGSGWQHTQVTNLQGTGLSAGTDTGADAETDVAAGTDDAANANPRGTPVTLPAALVRPAALVEAWLNDARRSGRLTTLWSTPVHQLTPVATTEGNAQWQARDASGGVLAQATDVVVTAAYGSAALVAPHVADVTAATPLRAVKGQMTLAPLRAEPLAPHALRQHGVFVPAYDDAAHPIAPRIWAMGSTYERGQNNSDTTPAAHARNAASLAAMHPQAHARLTQQAALGETVEWAQVRCASLDRLPLVGAWPAPGPIAPSMSLAQVPRVAGLWTVSALGSRGLTLAMLAAQLLVARLHGTPYPVAKRHAAALDPARFALKNARKQPIKRVPNVSH